MRTQSCVVERLLFEGKHPGKIIPPTVLVSNHFPIL